MGYGFDAGMAGVVPMSGGGTEAAAMGGKGKQPTDSGAKAFKRVAGGKSWKDETLADWPESESTCRWLWGEGAWQQGLCTVLLMDVLKAACT